MSFPKWSVSWRRFGPLIFGRHEFATCIHYILGRILLSVDKRRKP